MDAEHLQDDGAPQCQPVGRRKEGKQTFSQVDVSSWNFNKAAIDTKHRNGYLDLFQYIMSPSALGDVRRL